MALFPTIAVTSIGRMGPNDRDALLAAGPDLGESREQGVPPGELVGRVYNRSAAMV